METIDKKNFFDKLKILVVDDIPVMRLFVVNTLKELGFKSIYEADDGHNALELLEEECNQDEPIRIVISDINMPKMDGISLLENLRSSSNEKLKDLPFLIVTASNETSKIIQASELGVTNYILKPYSPESLKKKITDIFFPNDKED